MSAEFKSYGGEQIELLPPRKTVGDKKIVETQIVPADGGAPTELDYVVANGPNGWQITDVLLNGTISQVAVHSSDFSARHLGRCLATDLRPQTKVAALSGGTDSH